MKATEHEQQLSISENAENQVKEGFFELKEEEQLEGTPFMASKVINHEGKESWFITWGGKAVSAPRDTKAELETYLVTNQWDIIAILVLVISDRREEIRTSKLQNGTRSL